MKPYFLDTNILLDFLGNRFPYGHFALKIFEKGLTKEWQLWTSVNSILTTYCILSKEIGENQSRQKIGGILNFLSLVSMEKYDIQAAMRSDFKDLEDGVQHFCALKIPNITGIITRNSKDFSASQIAVFEPKELV
jgi:predicted nucleic acid-binding protein